MRILETQDVLLILFYRSIGLSAMVALFTCLRRRQSLPNFIKELDSKDLTVGIFLSIAFSGYVFSMIYTSVASTLFIYHLDLFLRLSFHLLGSKRNQHL